MNKYASIIGFDFSIAKPAACLLIDNKYHFISWPKNLDDKLVSLYRNSGINNIDRFDNEKEPSDSSEKVRYEIKWSNYMSDLIIETIKPYINNDTKIIFEGSSFGSKGNVVIQLTSRRYMLMYKLSSIVSLENMFTYAPTTVKKTAGCSRKDPDTGKSYTKNDVINSFIINGPECLLKNKLKENKNIFMKKGYKNYQTHLDDLIDSYWVLQTYIEKNNS
jgi:hypothetical protein